MISDCSPRGISHRRRCGQWECSFLASDGGDDNNKGDDKNFIIELIATRDCSSRCPTMDEGDAGGRGDDERVAVKVIATEVAASSLRQATIIFGGEPTQTKNEKKGMKISRSPQMILRILEDS
ncbi:radical SAM protein [Sesbania bispinosa]|nr:radical SAM protein [Sesbania bispinosa]